MFNLTKSRIQLQRLSFTGLALMALLPAGASVTAQSPVTAAKITPSASASDSKSVTVTDAQANPSVTLNPGDTLIVRLKSNKTTGFNWDPIIDPGFPLQMIMHQYISPAPTAGPPVAGRGGIEEFRFGTPRNYALGASSIGLWQRFLYLRPFEPGIKDATLWQVHVTLSAR